MSAPRGSITWTLIQKDQFTRRTYPLEGETRRPSPAGATLGGRLADIFSLHDDRQLAALAARKRNARTETRFLPDETGGARRDRTDDLKLAKLPLSQLSYGPDTGEIRRGGPGRT